MYCNKQDESGRFYTAVAANTFGLEVSVSSLIILATKAVKLAITWSLPCCLMYDTEGIDGFHE
jgi:hypothetical protein